MTTPTPWWYSGDAPEDQPGGAPGGAPGDPAGSRRPAFEIPGFDLAGLASGAQQLVDLARQALLAPHAGHADPSEHPDCVICRTMAAVGEVRSTRIGDRPARAIAWIELDPPRR